MNIWRAYLAGLFCLAVTFGGLALAQNVGPAGPGQGPGNIGSSLVYSNGHLQLSGTAAPKVNAACGTGATVVGNDSAFIFTSGTSTNSGCQIAPVVPYVQRPICSMDQQSGSLSAFSINASGLISLTGVADSIVYNFICFAQAGG